MFKGWLLLSLPSRCFWERTPFVFTLSRHLGALTLVWVVPLSERELTPRTPSPTVYGADSFGVRQVRRRFPSVTHQSVLYTASDLTSGLTAASFGRNQLSPGLIGLSPLAQGHPTELYIKTGSALHRAKLGFSLPRTRSPGFGSPCRDSGRFHTQSLTFTRCGPFAFATASGFNPLTSPRQGTPWPVFPDGRHHSDPLPSYHHFTMASFGEDQLFRAMPYYRRLVLGSFNPHSWVLFGFPSRYCVRYRFRVVFRVGS